MLSTLKLKSIFTRGVANRVSVASLLTSRRATQQQPVALTTERYPALRRSDYASLTNDDVKFFSDVVGPNNVLEADIEGYNTDWLRTVRG